MCVYNLYLWMAPNSWKRIEKSRLHTLLLLLVVFFSSFIWALRNGFFMKTEEMSACIFHQNKHFFSWLDCCSFLCFVDSFSSLSHSLWIIISYFLCSAIFLFAFRLSYCLVWCSALVANQEDNLIKPWNQWSWTTMNITNASIQ